MDDEEIKKELVRFIKYRNQMMDQYELYDLSIEERLPYLDTILRLNETVRSYRRALRLMEEG